MRQVSRKVAIFVALLGCVSRTQAAEQGGPGVRCRVEVVKTARGPSVEVCGVALGMSYERAVERAGGDRIGAFFGKQGPLTMTGAAEGGARLDFLAEIRGGRVSTIMLAFRGEHGALERIEAVLREALAPLGRPSTESPGSVAWLTGRRDYVGLAWRYDDRGEEVTLSVGGLGR